LVTTLLLPPEPISLFQPIGVLPTTVVEKSSKKKIFLS
jgi:hypothetical protein